MDNLFKKHITVVLKEMCSRVGADFDKIDFGPNQEPLYFDLYEWTEKQQQEFEDWLTDYMYNNSEARRALAHYPSLIKTKKGSRKFAHKFVCWYGWRIKKN
jgi:hypothetical protein